MWIGFKSVDDIIHTTPAASWARELAPLVNQLQEVGAEKGRVEVVPARSHREASALAPYVNLARGWNRQADMERNPLFYDDTLNSANYHEWLQRWAVHYVVLPKDEPDGDGGQRERAAGAARACRTCGRSGATPTGSCSPSPTRPRSPSRTPSSTGPSRAS